jgi:hypothetical protein
MSWPVEHIPDEDVLYRCAHRNAYNPKTGKLTNLMFNDKGDGVSVDWGAHSDPDTARTRPPSGPENNAVYELWAREVRYTKAYPQSLDVIHTAKPYQAHASIIGFYGMDALIKQAIREELLEMLDERGPRIPLGAPVKRPSP